MNTKARARAYLARRGNHTGMIVIPGGDALDSLSTEAGIWNMHHWATPAQRRRLVKKYRTEWQRLPAPPF